MEFHKLILTKQIKGFKASYKIADQDKLKYIIEKKSFFSDIDYLMSNRRKVLLEIQKTKWYNHDHRIFRNNELVAEIKNTKSFPRTEISAYCEDCKYDIVSHGTIKYNLSLLRDKTEIGKISRKVQGFKTYYGMAILKGEDLEIILSLLVILRKLQESQSS